MSSICHRCSNSTTPLGDWRVDKVTNMSSIFVVSDNVDQPAERRDTRRARARRLGRHPPLTTVVSTGGFARFDTRTKRLQI